MSRSTSRPMDSRVAPIIWRSCTTKGMEQLPRLSKPGLQLPDVVARKHGITLKPSKAIEKSFKSVEGVASLLSSLDQGEEAA